MAADLSALRAYLAEQVAVMRAAGDGWRRDAEESVHDLRVGHRRVRNALRTFGPALPADTSLELALRLKQCAAMLGLVRDLEVVGELLARTPSGPLRDRESRRSGGARGALERARAEVAGVAHALLVADLAAYVDGLEPRTGDLRPLAQRAAERADKRFDAAGRDPTRCTGRGRPRSERDMPRRSSASRSGAPPQAATEGLGIHHDCHVAAARLLSIEVPVADADERDADPGPPRRARGGRPA